MGRPLRIEFSGAFYHVTSRGNERKVVFKSLADRKKFLSYLESAVLRYGAVVHAYCLMSNHYHLLLETPCGNLAQIMQHINGAYTNYFNTKRKRAGHLFQGRYRAILVDADAYLLELSRYIHLNPVRAGMAARPEDHPWSSFLDYVGTRPRPTWLKTSFVLACLGRNDHISSDYRRFVEDLLEREYDSPLNSATAATILGGEEFVSAITARYVDGKLCDRDLPAINRLASRPTLNAITVAVSAVVGNTNVAKRVGLYLCHKYSGAKLQMVGEHFGIGQSAVSQASRRFTQELKRDMELGQLVDGIKANLKM